MMIATICRSIVPLGLAQADLDTTCRYYHTGPVHDKGSQAPVMTQRCIQQQSVLAMLKPTQLAHGLCSVLVPTQT